jgi:hypothetical protein
VPGDGLVVRLNVMHEFQDARHSDEAMDDDRCVGIRWCLRNGEEAVRFQERFGGKRLTIDDRSSRAPKYFAPRMKRPRGRPMGPQVSRQLLGGFRRGIGRSACPKFSLAAQSSARPSTYFRRYPNIDEVISDGHFVGFRQTAQSLTRFAQNRRAIALIFSASPGRGRF